MGPKVTNCCKPEQMGTKEHGKMLKRIHVLKDGRVPAKEAKNWKMEGKKEELSGKSIRSFKKFEMEVFHGAKRDCGILEEQDRGVLPREDGDVIRKYKAMHEKQGRKNNEG